MGVIITQQGKKLPITTWSYQKDSLSVIVLRSSMDKKWFLSGNIVAGPVWSAVGTGYPMESPFLVFGKPDTCSGTIIPPIDPPTPPRDTMKAGSIPLPRSTAKDSTMCFQMRFDYGNKCELEAFAKMSFVSGSITRGYINVGDKPGREYSVEFGTTDQTPSSIHIFSTRPTSGPHSKDTLDIKGIISIDRTMAKGEYLRLPSMTKGNWTMKSVVCANWTMKYPDESCFTK